MEDKHASCEVFENTKNNCPDNVGLWRIANFSV